VTKLLMLAFLALGCRAEPLEPRDLPREACMAELAVRSPECHAYFEAQGCDGRRE